VVSGPGPEPALDLALVRVAEVVQVLVEALVVAEPAVPVEALVVAEPAAPVEALVVELGLVTPTKSKRSLTKSFSLGLRSS
jgi:hypothetical protein